MEEPPNHNLPPPTTSGMSPVQKRRRSGEAMGVPLSPWDLEPSAAVSPATRGRAMKRTSDETVAMPATKGLTTAPNGRHEATLLPKRQHESSEPAVAVSLAKRNRRTGRATAAAVAPPRGADRRTTPDASQAAAPPGSGSSRKRPRERAASRMAVPGSPAVRRAELASEAAAVPLAREQRTTAVAGAHVDARSSEFRERLDAKLASLKRKAGERKDAAAKTLRAKPQPATERQGGPELTCGKPGRGAKHADTSAPTTADSAPESRPAGRRRVFVFPPPASPSAVYQLPPTCRLSRRRHARSGLDHKPASPAARPRKPSYTRTVSAPIFAPAPAGARPRKGILRPPVAFPPPPPAHDPRASPPTPMQPVPGVSPLRVAPEASAAVRRLQLLRADFTAHVAAARALALLAETVALELSPRSRTKAEALGLVPDIAWRQWAAESESESESGDEDSGSEEEEDEDEDEESEEEDEEPEGA